MKLPLSCEVVKKVVLEPPICRGGDTPHLGHAFSNRTYFRACGRFWLNSEQRARKVVGEKKKIEEEEDRRIAVKPKSADLTSRPNVGRRTVLDTSELAELLQQSAAEHLTTSSYSRQKRMVL